MSSFGDQAQTPYTQLASFPPSSSQSTTTTTSNGGSFFSSRCSSISSYYPLLILGMTLVVYIMFDLAPGLAFQDASAVVFHLPLLVLGWRLLLWGIYRLLEKWNLCGCRPLWLIFWYPYYFLVYLPVSLGLFFALQAAHAFACVILSPLMLFQDRPGQFGEAGAEAMEAIVNFNFPINLSLLTCIDKHVIPGDSGESRSRLLRWITLLQFLAMGVVLPLVDVATDFYFVANLFELDLSCYPGGVTELRVWQGLAMFSASAGAVVVFFHAISLLRVYLQERSKATTVRHPENPLFSTAVLFSAGISSAFVVFKVLGSVLEDVVQLVISTTTLGYFDSVSVAWCLNVASSIASITFLWTKYISIWVYEPSFSGIRLIIMKLCLFLFFAGCLVMIPVFMNVTSNTSPFCEKPHKLQPDDSLASFSKCDEMELVCVDPDFDGTSILWQQTNFDISLADLSGSSMAFLVATEITGTISILNNWNLTTISFPEAETIADVDVIGNPNLHTVSFPALRSILNRLVISDNPVLEFIEFSDPSSMDIRYFEISQCGYFRVLPAADVDPPRGRFDEGLNYSSNANLEEIVISAISTVIITADSNPVLSKLSWATTVSSAVNLVELTITRSPMMTTLLVPGFLTLQTLSIATADTPITQLTLPTSFPNITTFSISLAQSALAAVSFPVTLVNSLTLTFTENSNLASILLPNLSTATTATLGLYRNNRLTTVTVPVRTMDSFNLRVVGNANLTSISFPSLTSLDSASLTITGNPMLTTVNFPGIFSSRFTITDSDNNPNCKIYFRTGSRSCA